MRDEGTVGAPTCSLHPQVFVSREQLGVDSRQRLTYKNVSARSKDDTRHRPLPG
jgi:hypothetical protein